MKYWIFSLLLLCNMVHADTIANYIAIASNIPQMELKPDPQSQAWARSARQILAATDETIAETLVIMNAVATKQGKPLFCIPNRSKINPETMDNIIKDSYVTLNKSGANTQQMPISEVALVGMVKTYPCNNPVSPVDTAMITQSADNSSAPEITLPTG